MFFMHIFHPAVEKGVPFSKGWIIEGLIFF